MPPVFFTLKTTSPLTVSEAFSPGAFNLCILEGGREEIEYLFQSAILKIAPPEVKSQNSDSEGTEI